MTRLLTLALLLAGCADPIEKLCWAHVDCIEYPEPEGLAETCIESLTSYLEDADREGCGEEHEDYVRCAARKTECVDQNPTDPCDDACAEVCEALEECHQANVASG